MTSIGTGSVVPRGSLLRVPFGDNQNPRWCALLSDTARPTTTRFCVVLVGQNFPDDETHPEVKAVPSNDLAPGKPWRAAVELIASIDPGRVYGVKGAVDASELSAIEAAVRLVLGL